MTKHESTPRPLRRLLLALTLGLATAIAIHPEADTANITSRPPARLFTADSVVVHGPQRFYGVGSTQWGDYGTSFTADSIYGWRYYVRVVSVGISKVSLGVNNLEYIGVSDGGSNTRMIDVVSGNNGVAILIQGTTSSYIDVYVTRARNPMFTVFDDTLTRPDPVALQTATFTIPSAAVSPYKLWMINGIPLPRTANATLTLNGTTVLSGSDFHANRATKERQVSLLAIDTLLFYNQGVANSSARFRIFATDTTPPEITVTFPTPTDTLTTASSVVVAGAAVDSIFGLVAVNDQARKVTPDTFSTVVALPTDKRYTIPIFAINAAKKGTLVNRLVIRDTRAPDLAVDYPPNPFQKSVDTVFVVGSFNDSIFTTITLDDSVIASGVSGTFGAVYRLDLGSNRIVVRARDALGNVTERTRHVLYAPPESGVRDSTNTAIGVSSLAETGTTSFLDGVKFLYDAGSPVQTGVTTAAISAERAAVVRGQVTNRDFGALPKVTVQVLDHPEFGETVTRKDGRFDMIVNGGGRLTLRFSKPGYLEAQRMVVPAPNQYAMVDSVAMIGRTARVETVVLANNTTIRGRFKTDANGDRDIRVFFPSGTVAKVVPIPGDTVLLDTITVRATEYTVGSDGLSTMPGTLPPASAYTYCADLTMDEAATLRVSGQPEPAVLFTKTLSVFVRNFLHLPAGSRLPVGYYDRFAGKWMATPDGHVIAVRAENGGLADIDSDGDGDVDSSGELTALEMTDDERASIAEQFAPGDTIWRMRVDHFSPLDGNINLEEVRAQQSPGAGLAGQAMGLTDQPTLCSGCVIEVENRVLGESIPIVGTPFSLNYRSYRAPGDQAIRTLRLPVSGDTVPTGTQRILVRLDVAGQRLTQEFSGSPSALANKVAVIPWNGKDAFGRTVLGSVEATVSVGYQYGVRTRSGAGGRSLGDYAASGGILGPAMGDREVGRVSWVRRRVSLGAPSAASAGLGGWTISPHHFYDSNGRGALYRGDGGLVLGKGNVPIITSWTISTFGLPSDVAVAEDGTVYAAMAFDIWKIGPSGPIARIAGTGQTEGTYTDNVQANTTYIGRPQELTVGPDGAIYFTTIGDFLGNGCANCYRVCRIGPDGNIKSIAGHGATSTTTGDGGLATAAGFSQPRGIAIGPDGSIFVGDNGTHRIRRIAPNGYISTYAGTGVSGNNNISGRADTIAIDAVDGLTVDGDGTIYFTEYHNKRVRKVSPDGISTVVANTAMVDTWFLPADVAIGPDGALYIASGLSAVSHPDPPHRVYRRDPDGALTVVAGGGPSQIPYMSDNIPALGSQFGVPEGIAFAADGAMYLAAAVVKRISPTIAGATVAEIVVPRPDGREQYYFALDGRHLRTVDAITGVVRYRFNYNAAHQLAAIYDEDGDSTLLVRPDATHVLIHPPLSGVTGTTLSNGWLSSVSNPAGETVELEYEGNDGLLTTLRDGESREHTSVFDDDDGRLLSTETPDETSQSFAVTYNGVERAIRRTSGAGRIDSCFVANRYDGSTARRHRDAAGQVSYSQVGVDGVNTSTDADGSNIRDSLVNEPRLGWLAPMVGMKREMLPSGLARTIEEARTYSSYDPPSQGVMTSSHVVNGRPPQTLEYSVASRRFTLTSPEGRETVIYVDTKGRPTGVTIPGVSPITAEYDGPLGQPSEVALGGRSLTLTYNSRGLVESSTDAVNQTVEIEYDAGDRDSLIIMPGGRSVGINHDRVGNITSITPPGRPAHSFEYTGSDLTARYTPPSAGLSNYATQYRYNADQQLFRIERPDSANVRLDYHASDGRLSEIVTPRGSYRYFYGTSGVVDSISSPDTVTVARQYDGSVLIGESWHGKLSGSVSVELDRDSRPISQQVNGGAPIPFEYDNDGLLTRAGDLAITRRQDNGLIQGTSLGSVTTIESQNNVGQPWEFHAKFGATTLFRTVYVRDSLGRVRQITETDSAGTRVRQYAYSDSGFLKSVAVDGLFELFAYDGNGNRTRHQPANEDTALTATYDDESSSQDRLLRYKDTRFSYGAAGELAKAKTGDDSTLFSYDPLGNLVKIMLAGGDSIEYLVDGRNRRVARKLNGAVSHKWLYQDQLEPVVELDASNNIVSRFVYGTRAHVPDYMVKGEVTYRIVSDHLGSVRLVVNDATGVVAQRLDYDAWGKVVLDTAPGFQPFAFAGGLWDAATGLVRFGARDYDPVIGRWTLKDPIGFADGSSNLYGYVNSEPIGQIHPTGLRLGVTGSASYSGSANPFGFEFGLLYVVDPEVCKLYVYRYVGVGLGVGPGWAVPYEIGTATFQDPRDLTGSGVQVSAFAAMGGRGASASAYRSFSNRSGGFGVGGAVGAGAGLSGIYTFTTLISESPLPGCECK